MSYFELDTRQCDEIIKAIENFADGSEAESIINEYLAEEGGDLLKQSIHDLLPVSGRTWKGKKRAAKSTDPFKKTGGNLSVKISTIGAYHYLYFPDDGSNTERHRGDQQFMFEGAMNKSDEIANEIIERLLKRLEEA